MISALSVQKWKTTQKSVMREFWKMTFPFLQPEHNVRWRWTELHSL